MLSSVPLMKTPPFPLRPAAAAFAVLLLAAGPTTAAERPNIVLVMSDDMGFSDIGCYGGEIATPNLDRLAAGGLRFANFYNTGRCCPTRASLLTGLYPHQAGLGHMIRDNDHPGYTGELNENSATIAELLSAAGYRTYMAGKWHVCRSIYQGGPRYNWPLQRGFDRFYGTLLGAGSFYDPATLVRDNTHISPFADPEYRPETYYYTDAISDHATRFIAQHGQTTGDADRPFFLYVSYTAAHWPMHALPEDIARQEGKYVDGYEPVRRVRFEKLKALGFVAEDATLPPGDAKADWDAVSDKARETLCMQVYAAMVERMDRGIGQIVAELERTGRLENTLVLFLQDNGGCAEGYGRNRRGRGRAEYEPLPPEHLQRQMEPDQTRDGRPVRTGPDVLPGPADTYIAYGRGWANVSNTPFREYKHFVHEGGTRTPLIAHWPAAIGRAGEIDREPGHLVDIMATCLDVAGAEYPERRAGKRLARLSGESLRPVFVGEPLGRAEPLFWEHEGNRAIRDGDWKLVAKEDQPWELYNIRHDRSELHNVIDQQPDLAAKLKADWQTWAKRDNVLPVGMYRGRVGYEKTYGKPAEPAN